MRGMLLRNRFEPKPKSRALGTVGLVKTNGLFLLGCLSSEKKKRQFDEMKQDWLAEKKFGLRRLQRLDFIQAETLILFLIQEEKKWLYLQGAHVLALS